MLVTRSMLIQVTGRRMQRLRYFTMFQRIAWQCKVKKYILYNS
jgi:hypothetical protein